LKIRKNHSFPKNTKLKKRRSKIFKEKQTAEVNSKHISELGNKYEYRIDA
jgi:hypothetical protein